MVATISPSMLADLRRRGEKLTLIDVRTPAEFGEVHVDFARNIPLDRLDSKAVGTIAGEGPVYVICKSGTRSQKACEKRVAAGLEHIIARMPWNTACTSAKSCCHTAVLGLILGAMASTALADHTKDSLDTVKRAVAEKKAILVDVREPEEWEQGHVAGAKLVPLSALEKGVNPQDLARVLPKDKVIYCHCLAGGRCMDAAEILKPMGYDVRALKPGYPQLEKAGFPTAKGR